MTLLAMLGGIPRTGTNTIAAFLHLNEEVFCFATPSLPVIKETFEKAVSTSPPMGTHATIVGDEDFCTLAHCRINEKRNTPVGDILKKRVIVFRGDYVARGFGEIRGKTVGGRRTKLIFTMRKNLKDLYCSHRMMLFKNQEKAFPNPIQFFRNYMLEEFTLIEVMMGGGVADVFFVDMTQKADYEGIMNFLGLEMNPLQEQWAKENPRVNYLGVSGRTMYEQWRWGEKKCLGNALQVLYDHQLYRRLYG